LYSHVTEESNGLQNKIIVEKESRVDGPVKHLEKYHQLIFENIKLFESANHPILSSTYSTEYINKIFAFQFDANICGSCSFSTIESICDICGNETCVGHYLDSDTLITPSTKYALQESAKVLISIVDLDDDAAYALIRPPGHHSCQDQHEGFCIFNNVIILYNYIRISHSNLYFISMYYYDGKSYPRTGNISENTDYILNVPFNRNETDDGYLT
jgi:acetoin utilization deacetylase AcuC-like enzyme